jgi:N-formylglutamate amidohydrolase
MTDHATDLLFRLNDHLAQHVVFPVSRLIVDPERFPDDATEPMAAQGMGAVYVRTSTGAALRHLLVDTDRTPLLARFYAPHHQLLEKAVAQTLRHHESCLILDAHSFASLPLPHEPDQSPQRPDFCLGTDPFHTPAGLERLACELFQATGHTVEVNRPFAGALVPARYYRREPQVLSLMIEVNRKLYLNEATGDLLPDFEHFAQRLQQTLCTLIQAARNQRPQ